VGKLTAQRYGGNFEPVFTGRRAALGLTERMLCNGGGLFSLGKTENTKNGAAGGRRQEQTKWEKGAVEREKLLTKW